MFVQNTTRGCPVHWAQGWPFVFLVFLVWGALAPLQTAGATLPSSLACNRDLPVTQAAPPVAEHAEALTDDPRWSALGLQLMQTPPSVQRRIVLVAPSTEISSARYMSEIGSHVGSGVSTPQSPEISFLHREGATRRCTTCLNTPHLFTPPQWGSMAIWALDCFVSALGKVPSLILLCAMQT